MSGYNSTGSSRSVQEYLAEANHALHVLHFGGGPYRCDAAHCLQGIDSYLRLQEEGWGEKYRTASPSVL